MKATACLLLLSAWRFTAAPLRFKVQARTPNGTRAVIELPLERYVAGVLAGESSVFQSAEALKAMAVAARTYAVRMRGRHRAEGFDLCDTTHCQRFAPDAVTPRLEEATAATAGELVWFQGKLAFTPYTRDCGGKTEDAAAVWPDLAAPYLKSHEDPYCTRTAGHAWRWNADPVQVSHALQASQLRTPRLLERISILGRTPSNRVSTLMLIGGDESIQISATSFRFAVGRELGWDTIRSDRYELRSSKGRLIFEGAGAGHGVGLCERGAGQMGLAGNSYTEILAFSYPGTTVGLTGQGISWQRLGGEIMSLLTTQPDRDRTVLAAGERLGRAFALRTNWTLPAGIEIRAYPDLDAFRNATGEPGWVAAHTDGRRIHLQPIAILQSRGVLESTLSHELLHVLIESMAKPGLPVWFREGLAAFLENGRGAGIARQPQDQDLRQTADAGRARRAYADAEAMVANLVQTYGEVGVLDWVRRGLPLEVTKARASQAAPKSR